MISLKLQKLSRMWNYTQEWIKGETTQGKIMIAAGIAIGIIYYFLWSQGTPFYDGLLIPIILILILYLGYGAALVFGRPAKYNALQEEYSKNEDETKSKELERIEKDHKVFSMLNKFWIVVILVGIVGFFIVSTSYYKGVFLGVALVGIASFLNDHYLHSRIKDYRSQLES